MRAYFEGCCGRGGCPASGYGCCLCDEVMVMPASSQGLDYSPCDVTRDACYQQQRICRYGGCRSTHVGTNCWHCCCRRSVLGCMRMPLFLVACCLHMRLEQQLMSPDGGEWLLLSSTAGASCACYRCTCQAFLPPHICSCHVGLCGKSVAEACRGC
jgi:hypothetical protein